MISIIDSDLFRNENVPFNYRYLKPLFEVSLLDDEQYKNISKFKHTEKVNPYNTSGFSIESHHKPVSKIIDYSLFLESQDDLIFPTE